MLIGCGGQPQICNRGPRGEEDEGEESEEVQVGRVGVSEDLGVEDEDVPSLYKGVAIKCTRHDTGG